MLYLMNNILNKTLYCAIKFYSYLKHILYGGVIIIVKLDDLSIL